jgi:hypothetical protein
MPAALNLDWQAIRLAAVAGVELNTIALCHGLTDEYGKPDTQAIRKRAQRENWPTPNKVRQAAIEAAKSSIAHGDMGVVPNVSQGVSESLSGAKATVTVTQNLLQNGQTGSLAGQQKALRSILNAPDSLPIGSIGDLQAAVKLVRLVAGMDTQDSTRLSISLLGGNASLPDVESIDVEVVSRDDVTDDEVGD